MYDACIHFRRHISKPYYAINPAMIIKTAAQQIAEVLRNDIFSGKFLPGSKLKEMDVTHMLNVSRTPVREAFRILESDGLVKIVSNRGVQVRLITERDLDEVWELRRLVELYSIPKYINTVDEHDFQELEDNIQKTEMAVNEKDYFYYFHHSVNFHAYLMSLCQNERLYSTFLNARNSIRCAQMVLDKSDEFFRYSLDSHREFLQGLRERNLEKCLKSMEHHLDYNHEMMKKNLRSDKKFQTQIAI
jgi:DNA-binding GntR family transcriptional regulator